VREFDELKAALFAAQDGLTACHPLNKLSEHAQKGSEEAKEMLALYVKEGRISHMRQHACFGLAKSVNETHAEFAAIFRNGLSDPALRYWSTLGYLNSAGKAAYTELISIAEDTSIPLEDRAHAVKCLATFSKQHFDRGLPSNLGFWKVTDLRIAEVRTWANNGFPDGEGYPIADFGSVDRNGRISFEAQLHFSFPNFEHRKRELWLRSDASSDHNCLLDLPGEDQHDVCPLMKCGGFPYSHSMTRRRRQIKPDPV
jgi:hypothetical protein